MRWSPFHPGSRRLSRYVDGDLTGRGRARMVRHLGRCHRCRTHVQELRRIGQRAREARVPPPPDGLFERIKAALLAGERAILPTVPADAATGAPSGRAMAGRLTIIGAALVPVLLGAALAVFAAGSLEAYRPTLELVPGTPRAGNPLAVSFVGGSVLGGGDRLTLRARIFDGRGDWNVATAPLRRSRVRRGYGGEIILPPGTTYAVFAVEDSLGERVETGAGHPWEVVVRDGQGRPSLEGLGQQVARHLATRLDLALEAAHAMTEHHPGSAEGWSTLYAVERFLAGPERADELAERHRHHFARLEREFEVRRPAPGDLAAMALYARSVGDPASRERWTARLLRDAPHERLAVQMRIQELQGVTSGDASRLLSEYERLWVELGPGTDLAVTALALASGLDDGAAAVRWAERVMAVDPSTRPSVALRLARVPGALEVAMALIRRELRDIETAGSRNVRLPGVDVHAARLEVERTRTRLLVALGEALIEEGRPRAGSDTLRLAAAPTWDPEVFRQAAGALLSLGDTLEALPLLARVAADPVTGAEERSELDALAAQHLSTDEWQAEMAEARSRMRRQILASATRRRLPSEIPVTDRAGRSHDLRDLLHGEVAVVSLWYCFCAQFESLVGRHRGVVEMLVAAGVPSYTILVVDPDADAPAGIEGPGPGLPLLFDREGAALRAFGYAQTPAYFVVDAAAQVRFAYPTTDGILTRVEVLRQSEGLRAVPSP